MDFKEVQSDPLQFAALIAHQLQSPLSALGTNLDVLLGGYVGPISSRQRGLLEKAKESCDEGVSAIRRMLAIAHAVGRPDAAEGKGNVARVVHQVEQRFRAIAARHQIEVSVEIATDQATVGVDEEVLTEVLNALVSNALKYTPDHGRVLVRVSAGSEQGRLRISVGDSGVGIPEEAREHVWEPFYRTARVRNSARPGVGLGLSFVKAMVETVGGLVGIGKADLGGAEVFLEVPTAEPAERERVSGMADAMKIVIVGGVAAGPKVASKITRLNPHAEVTVIEKGEFLSYAGCGLPYYVSGVVKTQKELMATPVGTVRDPVFFQQVKHVRVLSQSEAMEVDRSGKRVRVQNRLTGQEVWFDYDKLVLCTGASPIVPQVPGVQLKGIFTCHGVNDAEGIKATLAEGKARDVVIVGGGLIGVEMTEALVEKGCRVTMVEMLSQILHMLDWEMARLVARHMESRGVKVLTETKVVAFEGDGDGRVRTVVTDKGRNAAEMVVLAIGVRPNVDLARKAGLDVGATGAIAVDEHLRTSDPDIYAAGDCVECRDLVTGRPCYVPLGSTANKQGRVAAINICGGNATFPGVLGSTVCKVFDYCVGRTGLTEEAARELGYPVVTVLSPAPDRAHYMPNSKLLMLKLVVNGKTRELLGAQAIGPGAGDKRIDVAAMALTTHMTVDELANADLCYAPPYSPAMDNLITAANIAQNKLDGAMVGVTPMEVREMLEQKRKFTFLDVRSPGEWERMRLSGSINIPLGALRARLTELDNDQEIVTFCQISLRGYEAARVLQSAGFKHVRVLDGGIAMWPYETVQ